MTTLWTFANSPLGLVIAGAVIAILLARVFTAKPAWQAVFDRHRPAFFDAVRFAEKAIPDGSENVALRRLDEALKWVAKLEPSLANQDKQTLARAITEAHDALKT